MTTVLVPIWVSKNGKIYIFQDNFVRNLGELGCHHLEHELTLIKSVL